MATFLELPAIRINQPMGSFFITKLTARDLLRLTFSRPLKVERDGEDLLYSGNQRVLKNDRTREIARYIESVECTFPNSIIIAANNDIEGNLIDEDTLRWRVELSESGGCDKLMIPTEVRLASIIDGQHRLNGFQYVSIESRLETELVCAVYLDLPNPYQAYIFATINYNQKKVDRSLALELFGFDLTEDQSSSWSPEKLAVFISRRLNLDDNSPFYGHIIVAAQDDSLLFKIAPVNQTWFVSTATVVDGILGLISSNPQRDRDAIQRVEMGPNRNRSLLKSDNAPLRDFYLKSSDTFIYTVVKNYFKAADKILFANARHQSYIFKTVGIQALFDVLKKLVPQATEDKDISLDFFSDFLRKVEMVDFSDRIFQASGLGRSRIKNLILYSFDMYSPRDNEKDRELFNTYDEMLGRT